MGNKLVLGMDKAHEVAERFSNVMLCGVLADAALATPLTPKEEIISNYAAELLVKLDGWYDAELDRLDKKFSLVD